MQHMVRQGGFTLLELIVVIIIIGILATLGFTQYAKTVEKGRTTEAKSILGTIRMNQQGYNQEYGTYATDVSVLSVVAPTACATSHYFSYGTTNATATATRCSTTAGKSPAGPAAYTLTLSLAGAGWGGSAGYY